jgi:hypothetical protein
VLSRPGYRCAGSDGPKVSECPGPGALGSLAVMGERRNAMCRSYAVCRFFSGSLTTIIILVSLILSSEMSALAAEYATSYVRRIDLAQAQHVKTGLSQVVKSKRARPGDVVIRHAGDQDTAGTVAIPYVTRVPHTGIFVGESYDPKWGHYNVVELVVVKGKSLIRPAHWTNADRFQDPGFYSVLDSDRIPVTYQGKLMRVNELPGRTSEAVRKDIVDMAKKSLRDESYPRDYVGFGTLKHSDNCGDQVGMIIDKAFSKNNVQVMSHKFPMKAGAEFWFKNPNFLKPGEFRNYAEIQFLGTQFDPSRLPGWLQKVDAPTLPQARPGGIEMTGKPTPDKSPWTDSASSREEPPFFRIRTYWTSNDRPGAKTEADVMSGFPKRGDRALVVGAGPETDILYKNLITKLGQNNVVRIDSGLSERDLQIEARKQRTNVILGVKENADRASPSSNMGMSASVRTHSSPVDSDTGSGTGLIRTRGVNSSQPWGGNPPGRWDSQNGTARQSNPAGVRVDPRPVCVGKAH